MPHVEITIPNMLAELVRSDRIFAVEADTVRGALNATCVRHPELRVHLFDESGSLRQHVSCFHNDRTAHDLSASTQPGDRIVVLQAVSGG